MNERALASNTVAVVGVRFRFSSLSINGIPQDDATGYDIAMSMWDQGARKMLRRLYRHHLPRRLRRGKK